MPKSRVAFLGLGTMGQGMVRNLLANGHAVVAWNRTASRAQALVEMPLQAADHPREAVKDAEFVVTCLENDEALEQVALREPHGFVAGLKSGVRVIDCGTTSRELTRKLAARVEAVGAHYMDAPMTGSKLAAEGGRLTFMVSGAFHDVEAAKPVLQAMGKHVVYVGESIGLGQAAKYCLNMVQAVMLEGMLEGYALASRMGVPLARMAEVLEHSAGKSGIGSFKTPYVARRDYSPHFRLGLMHKDLHLALAEAASMHLPLAAARTVLTIYDQAMAEGLANDDFVAIAKLIERWNDVSLRDDELGHM